MGARRVLLVDDDAAGRRLYRAHLTAADYEVEEAGSGIEAVERCEQTAFDLVVMDLNMPGLDGWMAMSLIKARRPQLPVLILSAMQGTDLRERATTAGAADFLSKPCPADTFVRAVGKAIK